MSTLIDKIKKEMTIDDNAILENNFELIKELILLNKNGTIEITDKENYTGPDLITLYLIGKNYAHLVGYCDTNRVSIIELIEKLSKPEGSVKPWLKTLRDRKKIKQDTTSKPVSHYISVNLIEGAIKSLTKITKEGNK